MTANFAYLSATDIPGPVAEAASAAENSFAVDRALFLLAARRALELGVKYVFDSETALISDSENLADLIHNRSFRTLTGEALFHKINYIRKTANSAAHTADVITEPQAQAALSNLHDFFSFVAERSGYRAEIPKFSAKAVPGNKNTRELTEYETRRAYIDTMLLDAGWEKNKNWIDEFEITEMPNKSN
ncbi:MAG: DUF4145 domain-containing protein, partial [Methanomicrobium sp.]|nr:DUF4145 domain-containing protein [Methanomicrobium sp.]